MKTIAPYLKRLVSFVACFCLLMIIAGIASLGVAVIFAMWPDKLASPHSFIFASLVCFALGKAWNMSKPAKIGCAACDRGDFQLGHHHDCPKASPSDR